MAKAEATRDNEEDVTGDDGGDAIGDDGRNAIGGHHLKKQLELAQITDAPPAPLALPADAPAPADATGNTRLTQPGGIIFHQFLYVVEHRLLPFQSTILDYSEIIDLVDGWFYSPKSP